MEMWLNTNFFWRENSNLKSYSDRFEKLNPKWMKMSYIIIYDYYIFLCVYNMCNSVSELDNSVKKIYLT